MDTKTLFALASERPIYASKVSHGAQPMDPLRPLEFEFRRCEPRQNHWINLMPTKGFLPHVHASAAPSVTWEEWSDETWLQA